LGEPGERFQNWMACSFGVCCLRGDRLRLVVVVVVCGSCVVMVLLPTSSVPPLISRVALLRLLSHVPAAQVQSVFGHTQDWHPTREDQPGLHAGEQAGRHLSLMHAGACQGPPCCCSTKHTLSKCLFSHGLCIRCLASHFCLLTLPMPAHADHGYILMYQRVQQVGQSRQQQQQQTRELHT
jgi:hypothetical protein